MSISVRTLWQLTKDGLIPAIRVGTGRRKITLYSVDALKAWLARQTAAKEGGEQ